MKTIRDGWASFQQDVLPVRASEVQQREMQRAFYAGAFISIKCAADGGPSPLGLISRLRALSAECEAFAARVSKGEA